MGRDNPKPDRLIFSASKLGRGEAALFAVHGFADSTVPVVLSDWLVARATAVGVPVEYHRVEGAGHGSRKTEFFTREVAPGQTAFDRMLDFAEAAFDTSVDGSATAWKTQRQRGKRVVVRVKVSAGQDLAAKARGKIKLKKKAHKLKPKKRKDARKIAKALKKGKKAKAKLMVKLTDGVGNAVTEKLGVKLKR